MSEPGTEEGGEDIFEMPTRCTQYHPNHVIGPLLVENSDGRMECPRCHVSYGHKPESGEV